MKNTYSIDINRSREDVFAFIDDDDNLKIMVPNLVEHEILEETPEIVGTTFLHVYEEGGRKMKMKGVVTEHDAPKRMAVKVDGALFGLKVAYDLEELGPSSTRLTQVSEAHFKHVFKLMGLLFRKKMEREGKKSQAECFARIKAHLEGDPSA